MNNRSTVRSPSYYVTDRTIQLIDVIEDWNLDYHLGCVVKYIERGSYQKPTLEDLREAAWYLKRAWSKEKHDHEEHVSSQQMRLEHAMYPPQTVCIDWNLSNILCSTLINIFLSQGCPSPPLKVKVLYAALDDLREEIILLEQE